VLLLLPIVKTRPSLTEKEENPVPTDAFQSRFGPSAGHCACHPVSDDMPFRSGPRQQGQSLPLELNVPRVISARTANAEMNFMPSS
jgi:hypothetical protein